MKEKKRKAPPVLTGYDPRAVERAPKFADGHLPQGENVAEPGTTALPLEPRPAKPSAPDGISGDWQ